MPLHTETEQRLKKATRFLADPSKLLGVGDFLEKAGTEAKKRLMKMLGFTSDTKPKPKK